jgi:HAD superfamily hydrolase (TIGR01509 family)
VSVFGVIFDLGSTLIYRTGLELEREKCAALAAFAAAEFGAEEPDALAERLLRIRLEESGRATEEQVEYLAAPSIERALLAQGVALDAGTLSRAEAVFMEPEVRVSRLYPDARETLHTLASMDLRMALISNAPSHRLILDITSKHGIDGFFDPLVSSAGFGRTKPHPAIFMHVLDAWRMPAAQAVMMGDALGADILGANRVGLRSILVDIEPNPDNHRFADLARPSARVTSLREIPDLVRRWRETGG